MEKWTKFNKIMSWFVMLSGVAGTLYLAITLFTAAGSLGSYSSYYSSAASSAIATYVWLGILVLLIGSSVSIGIFAKKDVRRSSARTLFRSCSVCCSRTVCTAHSAGSRLCSAAC